MKIPLLDKLEEKIETSKHHSEDYEKMRGFLLDKAFELGEKNLKEYIAKYTKGNHFFHMSYYILNTNRGINFHESLRKANPDVPELTPSMLNFPPEELELTEDAKTELGLFFLETLIGGVNEVLRYLPAKRKDWKHTSSKGTKYGPKITYAKRLDDIADNCFKGNTKFTKRVLDFGVAAGILDKTGEAYIESELYRNL